MTAKEEKKIENVIPLVKPITIEGNTISQLTMREPTAGDLETAEASTKTVNGNTIFLIGLCSGLHPNVVRQLGGRDYKKAAAFISHFLADAPQTGEN